VPHGIVAYVDLGGDDVERTLERHAQFDALRGVRDLRYDDYLTDARWRKATQRSPGAAWSSATTRCSR